MLKKLTYKQKTIALGVSLFLILVVGYQLGISKTLAVYQENVALENLTSKDENELLSEIARGTRRKNELDSLMKKIDGQSSRAEMITSLINLSAKNSLKVVGIREDQLERESETLYYLTFSGLYIHMVKFIRAVEKNLAAGKIESLKIFKEIDRRTKEEHLLLELVIKKLEYGS